MYCSKCGQELIENCDFCPKCGNKMGQKKGNGKIIVILLLIVTVVCGGVFFFMSRNAQRTETMIISDKESSAKADVQSESEIIVEEVDEMEEFFLSLSFEPLEMIMGETHQIQLEKKMTDAVWVSSDEKIVQVTDGMIKALTPGTATITVSLEENQKFFDVVVNPFTDMTLAVNCSKTMELNDIMSNVRWESSAPEIISVSEGTISSLSSGASIITAYIDEVPYSFEVVATTPDISTTSVRKIIGNTQQISILGTNGQVEWKSDNTAVATVTETGLITLEPTGAGQSTVVHAYVDGMEFKIDVEAEPIPQLSSTYKIYAYRDSAYWGYNNVNATVCANANETITLSEEPVLNTVLNVADADYSDGLTYPVYRTYENSVTEFHGRDDKIYSDTTRAYVELYLIGTSQKANVLIQDIKNGELVNSNSTITYTENDGYGVITVYPEFVYGVDERMVTVDVDGYTYEVVICRMEANGKRTSISPDLADKIPKNYVIEELSFDEGVIYQASDSSVLVANSRTYHTNNEWVERIGTKFVAELEDQAIEMVAGAVLKLILPF